VSGQRTVIPIRRVLSPVACFSLVAQVSFLHDVFRNTDQITQGRREMSKNHYSTKPKRRNRSGKRKDTPRIAKNMAKIKELERAAGRTA